MVSNSLCVKIITLCLQSFFTNYFPLWATFLSSPKLSHSYSDVPIHSDLCDSLMFFILFLLFVEYTLKRFTSLLLLRVPPHLTFSPFITSSTCFCTIFQMLVIFLSMFQIHVHTKRRFMFKPSITYF